MRRVVLGGWCEGGGVVSGVRRGGVKEVVWLVVWGEGCEGGGEGGGVRGVV